MGFHLPAARPATTYGLSEICARLGQHGHGPRWQTRYLDRLIERYGFPAPLPLMLGTRMIEGASPRSQWPRVAVDQWFEDRLPPEAAAREDRAARRQAEQAMDDRARNLGLRIVAGGAA